MIYYINEDAPEISLMSKNNSGEVALKVVSENNLAELIIKNLDTNEKIFEMVQTNIEIIKKFSKDVSYEISTRSIDNMNQRSRVSKPLKIKAINFGQNILGTDIKINVSEIGNKFLIDVQNKNLDKIKISYGDKARQIDSVESKIILNKNGVNNIKFNKLADNSPATILQLSESKQFINDFNIVVLPMFNYVKIKIKNNNNLVKAYRVSGNEKQKIFSMTEGERDFTDRTFPFNFYFYYRFDFYDSNFNEIRSETSDILRIEQNKYFGPSSKNIRNINSTKILNDDYKIVKNINNVNIIDMKNMSYKNILIPENNFKLSDFEIGEIVAQQLSDDPAEDGTSENDNIFMPKPQIYFKKLENGYTEVSSRFSIINSEKYDKIELYSNGEKLDTLSPSKNMSITFVDKKFNKHSEINIIAYDKFNKPFNISLSELAKVENNEL